MNLLNEEIKLSLVQVQVADGQTDPVSSRVDMAGYDGVVFVAIMGVITTTGTFNMVVKQAATDIEGTALSGATVTATGSANGDKLLAIDVFRPTKRYVGVVLTLAVANSIIGGVLAIQYKAAARPVVQAGMGATLVALVSPAES